jgi:plastocyanin
VMATNNSTDTDHPAGTWVPPRGSGVTGGPAMETGGNTTETTVTPPQTGNSTTPENTTGTGNTTGGQTGNQTSSEPGETKVSITQGANTKTDNAYSPNPVEVKVGDTVTWTNDDTTPHTATSGTPANGPDGKFGSDSDTGGKILAPGQSQSFTFTEAGEYDYYCSLHPNMVGKVDVS